MKNTTIDSKPPSSGKRLWKRHFTSRKLIDSKEEQISYVQIIGFALIFIGILYLSYKIFCPASHPITGSKLAMDFFIVMLGVAFAFPDLLSDNTGGLSTMRIVVFMMVNVICILLLDIGWGKPNFSAIGIDQYWVGIIAFVFGAKATQSFFESKMAAVANPSSITSQPNINSLSDAFLALPVNQQRHIIDAAIALYKPQWKQSIKNFTNALAAYKLKNGSAITNSLVIRFEVYPKDSNITPNTLGAVPQTIHFQNYIIPTDVLAVGHASACTLITNTPPIKSGYSIGRANVQEAGSLGAIVQLTRDNKTYGISCFHVLFFNELNSGTREIPPGSLQSSDAIIAPSLFDSNTYLNIGTASLGKFNQYIDIALFEITDTQTRNQGKNSAGNIYDIQQADENTLKVNYSGRTSGFQTGIVSAVTLAPTVNYGSFSNDFIGLIQLQIKVDVGDSGALVYIGNGNDPGKDKTLGIIVGKDSTSQYAYVIPMRLIFNTYGFN
ncbi:MAG: hypothetical protein ACLQQ4_17375 [Bacteroidia bacterium]